MTMMKTAGIGALGVLLAGAAVANTATTTQNGSHNAAMVDQVGSEHTAHVNTGGDRINFNGDVVLNNNTNSPNFGNPRDPAVAIDHNTVEITQGGHRHRALVNQIRTANTPGAGALNVEITQLGVANGNNRHTANVLQEDSADAQAIVTQRVDGGAQSNTASITQNRAISSSVEIAQVSGAFDNNASGRQSRRSGVDTANSTIVISQDSSNGSDNAAVHQQGATNSSADLSQSDGGDHISRVVQRGDSNSLQLTQNGARNTAGFNQSGAGISTWLQQEGDLLTAELLQFGNDGEIALRQSGIGNDADVDQGGDLHLAIIAQSGDGSGATNRATITQGVGSGFAASIAQLGGGGNAAAIVQNGL